MVTKRPPSCSLGSPSLMAAWWQGLPWACHKITSEGTSGGLWSHPLLRAGSAKMQSGLLGLLRLQKGLSPSRGRTCKLL